MNLTKEQQEGYEEGVRQERARWQRKVEESHLETWIYQSYFRVKDNWGNREQEAQDVAKSIRKLLKDV